MVVLGNGHTSLFSGWTGRSPFPAGTWPTSSGTFTAEPAGDVCVRLSLGAVRAAFGIDEWNGLLVLGLFVDSLRGLFLWNWLIYWLILGARQAHHYYDRYIAGELRLERLERTFSEARLNALRMQIEPHFPFSMR